MLMHINETSLSKESAKLLGGDYVVGVHQDNVQGACRAVFEDLVAKVMK
jgi:hypothetical protein